MTIGHPFVCHRLTVYLRIGVVNTASICFVFFLPWESYGGRHANLLDLGQVHCTVFSLWEDIMVNPQFLSWSLSHRAHGVLFLATCWVIKSLLRTDPWFCVFDDNPLSFCVEFPCTLNLGFKIQIFSFCTQRSLIVM